MRILLISIIGNDAGKIKVKERFSTDIMLRGILADAVWTKRGECCIIEELEYAYIS